MFFTGKIAPMAEPELLRIIRAVCCILHGCDPSVNEQPQGLPGIFNLQALF
jgi:hypothetical protein